MWVHCPQLPLYPCSRMSDWFILNSLGAAGAATAGGAAASAGHPAATGGEAHAAHHDNHWSERSSMTFNLIYSEETEPRSFNVFDRTGTAHSIVAAKGGMLFSSATLSIGD